MRVWGGWDLQKSDLATGMGVATQTVATKGGSKQLSQADCIEAGADQQQPRAQTDTPKADRQTNNPKGRQTDNPKGR